MLRVRLERTKQKSKSADLGFDTENLSLTSQELFNVRPPGQSPPSLASFFQEPRNLLAAICIDGLNPYNAGTYAASTSALIMAA